MLIEIKIYLNLATIIVTKPNLIIEIYNKKPTESFSIRRWYYKYRENRTVGKDNLTNLRDCQQTLSKSSYTETI